MLPKRRRFQDRYQDNPDNPTTTFVLNCSEFPMSVHEALGDVSVRVTFERAGVLDISDLSDGNEAATRPVRRFIDMLIGQQAVIR